MTSRNKTSISFSRCRKRLSGQTLYNIIPQRLRANEFHVIPEGGSIAPGTLGYVFAMEEVCRQMKTLHVEFDHVISTVCSSGKMAGMLLGKSVYNMKAQIYGINVCDDAPYFQERISNIIREARRKQENSVSI
ncbi:hypothetical protein L0337_31930 [candidate division KSB1 bacterium]|nr:hypothetical protein [candidate division KSB1 bacterium]